MLNIINNKKYIKYIRLLKYNRQIGGFIYLDYDKFHKVF